ncbi:O-succinylbenzoate-CoA ligase [Rhodococcus opacus PD630]|uniref:class I adenylate-forming enzyme family protein n=1 Tax=Rhodococcus opacus TaxID=37919 RepID=UPI00029CB4DA|nr:AMP-binding protein [Rhodococcus opacus]AHK36190.1 Long-chain-fatty-acid--CoA ligase [Rhodococcus opacus PD630]EHI43668.1 O-succinylbenzoate-CoA ligase [Rhodococcus opacus PD630]UDH01211.1 AMP-binding protein [Rhodococcus opacus PD630]
MGHYGEALLIGTIPHQHARLHTRRDKPAVIEGSDHRLTWGQVSERTARLAHALAACGVKRGDKVAAMLQNRAEYAEIVFALAGLGAAVVPISYRFTPREVTYALTFADVVAVIVDADMVATFTTANDEVGLGADQVLVLGNDQPAHDFIDYETALAASSAEIDYLVAEEWDVYHLAFTGGTTGYPKACEVPQRIAVQNWQAITAEIGILEQDTTLIAGPFYHGLGFVWGLQQLMVGGTVVMLRTFDAQEVLETIEREKVTRTPMAPTMYSMILELPGKERYDVGSMRGLVCAAAPLLTATKEALLSFFPAAGLFEYYGSTEAGFFSVLKPEDQLRKVRSVGLPFAGTEVRILNEDGQEVPVGEIGAIYKRGLALGARYYKNPEATAEAFRGEWMTSGDLGLLDEEGYLYVVDRMKDMIISGGVNIFPTEIEEVLSQHPDVAQVAVIGIPHEAWGETVAAYVVPRTGAAIDTTELDALCREQMAAFKRPRIYEVVHALPQNSSGKLLKTELRAFAQAAHS